MSNLPGALIVTRNLPPLVGGMEKLVWHMIDALRQTFDLQVIGPKGCAAHLPEGIASDEIPSTLPLHFLPQALRRTLLHAHRKRPKLIIAGSGLTTPIARITAYQTKAPTLAYLHGLDISPPHRLYRLLWQPCFRRMDRILVNSHYTHDLAIATGIPPQRITCLHPGVTLPPWEQRDNLRQQFRARYGFADSPLILSVGRLTPRKGLSTFIRYALPKIIDAVPATQLAIIGGQPTHALLAQEDEYAKIQIAMEETGLSKHVHFLGQVSDTELSAAYFAADVFVFPIREDANNPEGFGMVAIEAAAHGLPTVAFACGGVTDAVQHGRSGYLIPHGAYREFSNAVNRYLTQPTLIEETKENCRRFAEKFSWTAFNEQFRNICLATAQIL